ncbi:hypothetical protein JCM16161A_09520 [Vulcanisaeta sp. JCM 16161]|uniref:hypothetical protein n=1 Tax=Vulcanisaeta sp. JCM 16161 TaxID=1295372 RepID=UPI0006CF7A81|nr:hypothetical protein [Vulcanisaeta sp. JCM 16161]
MNKEFDVKIEDIIKLLLYSDSHWINSLRKIDFSERMKIVHDAVNAVFPDFVDCVNKSLDSDVPRLMFVGCFDMVWQSVESTAKNCIRD